MKKISFDALGNLSVTDTVLQMVDGVEVEVSTAHEISAGQLAAHLPMFEADMTAQERAQAQAIIDAQAALNG